MQGTEPAKHGIQLSQAGHFPLQHPRGLQWRHTIKFLHHLVTWLGPFPGSTTLIWDGASCHTAQTVQTAAAALGLTLLPLPGYSPDLNPIEGLWKWMREEVTHNHCYATMRALFDACKAFIDRINVEPLAVINRLTLAGLAGVLMLRLEVGVPTIEE